MTYEYICTACSHEWEASQPISAAPLTKCPKCKKNSAKRQISGGTGFLLKGGGWYADLYSSPGAAGKAKEKSEDGASKTASADTASTSDTPKKKEATTKADAPAKAAPKAKPSAD